jgi:hypothetical protein
VIISLADDRAAPRLRQSRSTHGCNSISQARALRGCSFETMVGFVSSVMSMLFG